MGQLVVHMSELPHYFGSQPSCFRHGQARFQNLVPDMQGKPICPRLEVQMRIIVARLPCPCWRTSQGEATCPTSSASKESFIAERHISPRSEEASHSRSASTWYEATWRLAGPATCQAGETFGSADHFQPAGDCGRGVKAAPFKHRAETTLCSPMYRCKPGSIAQFLSRSGSVAETGVHRA